MRPIPSLLLFLALFFPIAGTTVAAESLESESAPVEPPAETLAEIRQSFWTNLYNPDGFDEMMAAREAAFVLLLAEYRAMGMEFEEVPNPCLAVRWAAEGQPAEVVVPLAIMEAMHLHPDAHQLLMSIHRGKNPWFQPGIPDVAEYFEVCELDGVPSMAIENVRTMILQTDDPREIALGVDRTFDLEEDPEAFILRGVGIFRIDSGEMGDGELWAGFLEENLEPNQVREYLAYCALQLMNQWRWDDASRILDQAGDEAPMSTALALSHAELALTSLFEPASGKNREDAIATCATILLDDDFSHSMRAAEILARHSIQHGLPKKADDLLMAYLSFPGLADRPPLSYFAMEILGNQ